MRWFLKTRPQRSSAAVEWVERPWSQDLVLVCQDCDGPAGLTGSDALKAAKASRRCVTPITSRIASLREQRSK